MDVDSEFTSRGRPEKRDLRLALDLITTIAVLVASGAILYAVLRPPVVGSTSTPSARREVPVPAEPLAMNGAQLKGNTSAPIGIIEFSEFQCPFCARFATNTLPTLVRKYVEPGDVLFAFRHFPLANHQAAAVAAEIASCAPPHALWRLHDTFFVQPQIADLEEPRMRAARVGIDERGLGDCLGQGTGKQQVNADIAIARALGVRSTPVFFIGSNVDGSLTVS